MSPDSSYGETIEYLYALQKHGIKLALANSETLMELMGDPHRKFPSVHVAGTNGKGSTSAFIAGMLHAAGFRVGLYTSPHLVSFTERIRIDNAPITEAKTVELARRVREAYQRPSSRVPALNPTFFEVTTAMAFTCFAEEKVDIAVIETGMGGRLDATNVVAPLATVITNIAVEHTEYLGPTLELIAGEKAGIIKPGVPVVTGVTQPGVIRVIEREAAARRAPVYRLTRDFSPGRTRRTGSGSGQEFQYRGIAAGYDRLRIALLGGYQVDNACLALAAIECLRGAGIAVSEAAVRGGLEHARWEGRLERVARKPDVYLDGAHNPASARMLAGALKDMMRSYRRLVLVLGILGDKDFRGIIAELVPLADRVIVTRPGYSRAMDLAALSGEVRALHGSVAGEETVSKAIAKARAEAAPDDLIVVTGSLYVVGDARAAIVDHAHTAGALSGLKG
jgi:dihydrofolate synthase/folylpolyglutamate synthase